MSKKVNKPLKSTKKKDPDGQWINDDVKVNTGLPPQVDGQIRCFCKVSVSQVIWTITKPPQSTLVRIRWWGEQGDGSIFRPLDVKKGTKSECKTTARYPVRSGPHQFATYLADMGKLSLDVLTSPNSEVIGQANVTEIVQLSNTRPINGFFPVISPSGQKLANVQVAVVLEPLMDSYDQKGSTPTTDTGLNVLKKTHDSMTHQTIHPEAHTDMPARPDNTIFISPTHNKESQSDPRAVSKTYHTDDLRQRLNYATPAAPVASNQKDILSVLVDKGTKLREAMIVSSMHTDLSSDHISLPFTSKSQEAAASSHVVPVATIGDDAPRSAVDLLMASPIRNHDLQLYNLMNGLSPGTSLSSDAGYDQMMSEPEDPLHENSILQDLFYYNSDNDGFGLSDVSSYDHRHYPHTPEHAYTSLPSKSKLQQLDDPGNQRPPSRASSLTSLNLVSQDDDVNRKKKTKRKARSRSRSSSQSRSRSNSRTRSNSLNRTLKASTETNPQSSNSQVTNKPKKKLRSRSRSNSRSRSRSQKRRNSMEEASDSDKISVAQSETSRVSFDPVQTDMRNPKQEGLSVERLTLLGRVHVARVNVDSLQLVKPDLLDTSDSKLSVSKLKTGRPPVPKKSKKACTYFVEYQFPVVAASRDKYSPSAMATEVTRIASKNVKNGAVVFNTRSVFPIMFDGVAVERWWKSALVFRLYSKEPGEHTATLIGSGGISLKSILRSENLFVQRDIEIPDTTKNGLNTSRTSSLNSSLNNRNNAHLFGHLKISVELASDHKEFATVLARTKLAEMSGNVKIVPIVGPNPELAKLAEQLSRNKDQPVIKSPTKRIDFSFTLLDIPAVAESTTSNVLAGLPPQSPRRKPQAEDEGDEISRLKQQLKNTLAVLNTANTQHGSIAQMDSGALVLRGQPDLVGMTLHTLLYIQEGRQLSITGVPPLHMAQKYPALVKPPVEGRDAVVRNTYLVCRMFWCNDSVHSNVCWGTLNPEYNFLQVAPVIMTPQLLERLRDNYMIVEVWDKKVASENDKLIGIVKLSLHQFYMSFRERKIANALLKSEYPVMALDNYMPIVDPFSGLHFGQLKVVLAMGSEPQVATLQRLVIDSSGMDQVPQKPLAYLERQDLLNGVSVNPSARAVEHQFEINIEGLKGLKLFEKMMWGEADCFVQYFFPSQGEEREEGVTTVKSLPTMKCFRTATTLCIPDPTFHDTSRHKLILPFGTPVQRELLTACANSGGGVSGLPFEVWCRYYHPNVRDQLIAKSSLPLAKLCAMITMHKKGESCIQSYSLRLSQVGADGQQDSVEAVAKSKDVGVLEVTVNYKSLPAQCETASSAQKSYDGSQVCLSVGIIRASGLKAAADAIAHLDSSMAYPADVGVNAYVRIKISFLGKENERMTKTVARSFSPEFTHYIDFPCPLLMSNVHSTDATSLAELLESGEAEFEVWHQIPTGLNKDFQMEKSGSAGRRLTQHTGDVLLGTAIVPLVSLLTRRTGISGWFAVNLPSMGWTKPVDGGDAHTTTALDQVAGGLELSIRFPTQEDRDRVVSAARSVGWGPIDLDVEQPDWQDEGKSHHNVHNITVSVDQVTFPVTCALLVGQTELDPTARCYVRYKFYDKGAVASKGRKIHLSDTGSLLCSLSHKQSFVLSHTAPLQWYLREERLEIQTWVTYGRGTEGERRPRQRDKLIGSCYIDLESLTDTRRGQQRISGLFPLFKPGSNSLKAAFIRAHITSRINTSARHLTSEEKKMNTDLDVSQSETDQSVSADDWTEGFSFNKTPKKGKTKSDGANPDTSFGVLLAVERAMHLPMVSERNRSGEICPSTYVSYQSAERSKPSCSSIFPNSTNPVWDYVVETRLSTEYLYKLNKNLILKVWHKPSDASKTPDKSSDRVLGFVSVDLSSLAKGLHQICGWYNIIDFNGQCKGQIKVSITPQDLQHSERISSSSSTSLLLPNFGFNSLSLSTNTNAVASRIVEQLHSLQQHVIQKMGILTNQDSGINATLETESREDSVSQGSPALGNTSASLHWRPNFTSQPRTEDPSKSFLYSSLRRQLQDLDTMTQSFKTRLSVQHQALDAGEQPWNTATSGEILTGTQSDLSSIHTASSLFNTQDSPLNVATSQESTKSHNMNHDSPVMPNFSEVASSQESTKSHNMNHDSSVENVHQAVKDGDKKEKKGRKLLDSGIYSARNLSEKSVEEAPDSQRSDKNILAVTSDTMSTFRSGYADSLPQATSTIGTLEGGFLAVAASKTQTLLPTIDNSESSGNSHGFTPGTQRSNATESFSFKGKPGSKPASAVGSQSDSKPSQSGSGSARSDSRHSGSATARSDSKHSGSGTARSDSRHSGSATARSDSKHQEHVEEDEDVDGRYGSYHQYRELLDEAEDESQEGSDDDVEEVKIIPRSLNNISTVLALGANPADGATIGGSVVRHNSDLDQPLASLQNLALSPASPSANAHEGTSIWCSDDNDDSFFEHVFEKNKQFVTEDDVGDMDSLLKDELEHHGNERLEKWLKAQKKMAPGSKVEGDEGTEEQQNKQDVESLASDEGRQADPGQLFDEDMRLQLDNCSEHEQGEETHRGITVWNQNAGYSSDEDTSRNMWTKKHSVEDFFDVADVEFASNTVRTQTKNTEFDEHDIEPEFQLDFDHDKVSELPTPKSLLSKVELLDTLTSTGQNKISLEASSSLKSTSAPQTLQSTFSEISSLASNQRLEYPYTLELPAQQTGEGARPKLRHLLSNVDLESESSTQRPNSGSSKKSLSSHTASKTSSIKSVSSSSKASGQSADVKQHSGSSTSALQDTSKPFNTHNPLHTAKMNVNNSAGHDKDSTVDSAYNEGESDGHSTHPSSILVTNGVHRSTDDGNEDSGVDQPKESIYELDSFPNFFMPAEDMQASLRAIQLATAAASSITKDDLRAERKVEAVSQLVNKITASKVKVTPLSLKNKLPPSAEESKRIAKIFSSKIS
ncbi:C2 domain-containing protein 3-like [Physella acuta]|uniref:C2 domain-containing protein 3-like n=1 Tax=Physella acuta TaxID=109671 RepID=UPI0027DBD7FC|nr:C2 domain-containing protein 3-like [Physella acuta]